MEKYVGRFAPSPTGDLHQGSLVCALASYLDARAHNGTWLIRIENIDPPREKENAIKNQLRILDILEMHSDEPILYQSHRLNAYGEALEYLKKQGKAYGCCCTRKSIEEEQKKKGLDPHVYPGTCRKGLNGHVARSWRFWVPTGVINFKDRWDGKVFSQNLETEVGDFVLKRADGLWAYQLAVVVDDAFQGITHIVRGADLLDNTPRQIALQNALNVPTPKYMHVPLVLAADGLKLSKQNGATPLREDELDKELIQAWNHLGFESFSFDGFPDFYRKAIPLWRSRFL